MDISLDLKKTSGNFNDLLFLDGDLVFTSDQDPNGANPVLQDVLQRLRFFYQEWYLDSTQGIPYLTQVFVKNPDLTSIDAILMNVISGTPGVLTLTSYSSSLNTVSRNLTVKFRAQTTSGVIIWSGSFPITGGTTPNTGGTK